MSGVAQAVLVPAAAVASAAPSVLQRACACGGGAGPSGRCATCETGEKLGLQAKLNIGPPGDAFEQEADRIADAVTAGRNAGSIATLTAGAVQRQADPQDEQKAVLQPQGVRGAKPSSPPPLPRQLTAATQGGRPLHPTTRAMFEPRFGRSLSYVRLHDGPDAQALSRRIAARAVTHGADILFAPGQLNEVSTEGRRLLAHEITHTVQQGATTTLRRAPAPESDAPDLVQPHEVTMIVLENPTGARTNITYVNNEDGLFTFYRPIYPRDSIFIELESNFSDIEHVVGPIAVRFETEGQFERSDPGGPDPQLTLRVLAAPEEETEARLYLSAPNVAGEMEMVFNIGIVPLDIDPVQDLRLRKRAERRSLRRAQRDARRALRAERRADDDDRDLRAEMRALRRQQRTERQTFRKGRRQALSEAREERADEIEAARAAHGKHACTRSQRSNVSEAMGSAISRLDSALSHIRPSEPPDKYRMEKLEECFKIDPATASPAELTRIQTRAVDILNIARTSMLLSDPALVRCGAEPGECRPGAAAFVTDRVRGNPVTICQIWLDDNMIVEATKLEPGTERIYTLIHEFCHLAGVTDQSDEVYLHEKAWASLDSATAQTMAEAYAAFAWYMSSPGLE